VRSCDAASSARVCARLGCTTCGQLGDLVACIADATANAALAAMPLGSAGASSCRTAVARALGRVAGARMTAIVACADRGASTCVPPPSAPPASPKGLVRPCASPPADVCGVLGCDACGSAPELAACLATSVGEPVDGLASTILGVAR
jgi:hypothetical protein